MLTLEKKLMNWYPTSAPLHHPVVTFLLYFLVFLNKQPSKPQGRTLLKLDLRSEPQLKIFNNYTLPQARNRL